MGRTTALGLVAAALPYSESPAQSAKNLPPIQGLAPTDADALSLAPGLRYQVLASQGLPLTDTLHFGDGNDYLAFFPLDKKAKEGILWVNHEYLNPLFISGTKDKKQLTAERVLEQMKEVGGSLVHIRQARNKSWEVVPKSSYNRRLDANTPIPFAWDEPIAGAKQGLGTLANCAGGVTPWGTVLTCEENYDGFWGENSYDETGNVKEHKPSSYGWDKFFDRAPEHYGWVVEINPKTGVAKKLVALGRCAHECATTHKLPDGRVVVYTGDDCPDQFLYKFISDKAGSLDTGTLYIANTEKGQWLPLVWKDNPALQAKFKSQTEVLIRVREAGQIVGATPLDRPEDIEIDPLTGTVFVSLTNNKKKGNYYGSILKIEETNNDKASLTFRASTFLAGGPDTGFACPDNLAFDRKGNLWFTSDMAGDAMHKGEYAPFKNNGLFYVPMSGPQAGQVIRMASAPTDAELTGPYFHPDGKTLFLCVQHPGEQSKPGNITSHWPLGGDSNPKSSVVTIQGELLERLVG